MEIVFFFHHTGFSLLNANFACPILFFFYLVDYSAIIIDQISKIFEILTGSIVFLLHIRIKDELDVAKLLDLPTFIISPTFSALSSTASCNSCKHCFASSKST